MDLDLDTFLVTVYCMVDDLYQEQFAPQKPVRPGPWPTVSDSEMLLLTLLAQWQSRRSERAFRRYVRRHWRAYFPRVLSQSSWNRRARDLGLVLCHLGPAVSEQVEAQLGPSAFSVLDGIPVPVARHRRGRRHRLFGAEAAKGRGGSDHAWYFGVKVEGAVNAYGLVTGFVYGPANTEERWLAEALLRWRHDPAAPAPTAADLRPILGPSHRKGGARTGPTGPLSTRAGVGPATAAPYLSDLGLEGRDWIQHWRAHYGATVLTKADYAAKGQPQARARAERWLAGRRQLIETVYSTLCEAFGWQFPRARTNWGLLTRLAAKIAALNILVAVNYRYHRPTFAHFPLLD